jgi:hypothetical protein
VTPLAPLIVGAVLCFFGAWSVRLAVLLAGFGAGWVLAEALGASAATALVVGACAAVVLGVLVLLMTRFLFLVAGGCVGAVIGARLFVVLEADAAAGHGSWLVGLVFVAAVALLSGFLASRWRRRFLLWGTALAGSALALGGIGRLWNSTDQLWRPHSTTGSVLFALAWVVLTVVGHRVQTRHRRREDED